MKESGRLLRGVEFVDLAIGPVDEGQDVPKVPRKGRGDLVGAVSTIRGR